MKHLRIGLFGCGVVGSGVCSILQHRQLEFLAMTGLTPTIERICVKDPERERHASVDRSLITTDAGEILDDASIDVVIEVIGGERDALGIISRALVSGKDVISANKLVIAKHRVRLNRLQELHGGRLFYGAAVCGSIPVLKVIDETLATDRVCSIRGILNGSTNFVLGELERGNDYDDAIRSGREKGFLEADPHLDLAGIDAAQKLSILAWHAFGRSVDPETISVTGIESIDPERVRKPLQKGRRLKLIAEGRLIETGHGERLDLSVAPVEVGPEDPLYQIDDEMNGVTVECDGVGRQFFSGRGAGSIPTANAVVSDLLDLIPRRAYRRSTRIGNERPVGVEEDSGCCVAG